MGVVKIIGGKVINRGVYTCADVIIKDGEIISVGSQNVHIPDDATIIDASGKWVSAGFIDLHTHGAGGGDFMDGRKDINAAMVYVNKWRDMWKNMPIYPVLVGKCVCLKALTNSVILRTVATWATAKATPTFTNTL